MEFGPAQPELLPGARNAIEICLAIQPGERVALIADLPSTAVTASLAAALKERDAICEGFLLEDLAPRPLKRGPQEVLDALGRADAGILCMQPARSLTVRTEAGTSLVATFDAALDWVKTSGLISRRYWSNLPAGEVFTTPAKVDGTFVCDGTAGDHFCGKYGDLQRTPLVLEIQAGRLQKATCERKDL